MSVIIVRVGEKTFKNIVTGPGKLPGLSRNGSQGRVVQSPIKLILGKRELLIGV